MSVILYYMHLYLRKMHLLVQMFSLFLFRFTIAVVASKSFIFPCFLPFCKCTSSRDVNAPFSNFWMIIFFGPTQLSSEAQKGKCEWGKWGGAHCLFQSVFSFPAWAAVLLWVAHLLEWGFVVWSTLHLKTLQPVSLSHAWNTFFLNTTFPLSPMFGSWIVKFYNWGPLKVLA